MNICQKVIRYISYLARLKLFFTKRQTMLKYNSEKSMKEDTPKTILSWNVQGMYLFMNTKKEDNIVNQIREFNKDIVCLQEVFDDSLKEKIINDLGDIYPYYLMGINDKKYIIGEDSGLLVLSKYKIQFHKEVKLDELLMPDKLANKSIIYFTIGRLNMMTTHLQSNSVENTQGIIRRQIQKIKKEAPFTDFIVTGDLNNNAAERYLNVEKNNTTPTSNKEILDYIVCVNCNHITLNTRVPYINIENTSDHLAITAEIYHTKNY